MINVEYVFVCFKVWILNFDDIFKVKVIIVKRNGIVDVYVNILFYFVVWNKGNIDNVDSKIYMV